MSDSPQLFQVENLTVDFELRGNSIRVVDSFYLQVQEGETVGIVGESGSGKSVASLAMMGLIKKPGILSSGSVKLSGIDMLGLSKRQLRQVQGDDISMIFQEPTESLNPVLKIGRQIDEVLVIHARLNRSERKARVLELLNQVGLKNPDKIQASYPHQLSGGMNQRVMIAMAIACHPRLLIADEPTTALDVTVQRKILELLHQLQQQTGMAMIFISHDLSVVSTIADKIIVMYAGEIVEVCNADQLFKRPAHPYTDALLKSLPSTQIANDGRLQSIAGSPPEASMKTHGCRFEPRCPAASAVCREQHPQLVTADDQALQMISSHKVRCFFPLNKDSVAGLS